MAPMTTEMMRELYDMACTAVSEALTVQDSEGLIPPLFPPLFERAYALDSWQGVLYMCGALSTIWGRGAEQIRPGWREATMGQGIPPFVVTEVDGTVHDDPDALAHPEVKAAVWAVRFALASSGRDAEMATSLFNAAMNRCVDEDVDFGPYLEALFHLTVAIVAQVEPTPLPLNAVLRLWAGPMQP